jgi:hypothetical protein
MSEFDETDAVMAHWSKIKAEANAAVAEGRAGLVAAKKRATPAPPDYAALLATVAKATQGQIEVIASDPTDGFECYWLIQAVPFSDPVRGWKRIELGVINGPQTEQQAANAAAIVAAVNFCRDQLPALLAEREALREALQRLYRGYVATLETGRDRIMDLGGTCDPVDVMEEGDPFLRAARQALGRTA